MLTEKTKAIYMSDLDYFSSLLENNPDSGLHLPVAALYNRLERYSEGAAIARQGIELNKNYSQLQVLLAEALIYEGKDDEALELLYDVIVIDEDNYKALKLLGTVFKSRNNQEEALSYIQAAYLKAPEDSQLLAWLQELGGAELKYTEPEPEPEEVKQQESDEDFPENKVQAHLEKADEAIAYFKDRNADKDSDDSENIDDEDLLAALNMGGGDASMPEGFFGTAGKASEDKINDAPLDIFHPIPLPGELSEEAKAPEIPVEAATVPEEEFKLSHPLPKASELMTHDDEEPEPAITLPASAGLTAESEEFKLSHPLPKASELITYDDEEAEPAHTPGSAGLTIDLQEEFKLSHPLPKASELITPDTEEHEEPKPEEPAQPAETLIRSALSQPPAPDSPEETTPSPYDGIDRFVIGQTTIDGRALAPETSPAETHEIPIEPDTQAPVDIEETAGDTVQDINADKAAEERPTIEAVRRQMASTEPVEAYPNNNVLLSSNDITYDDSEPKYERLFDTSMIPKKELDIEKSQQGFTYSVDELMDYIMKEKDFAEEEEENTPEPSPEIIPENSPLPDLSAGLSNVGSLVEAFTPLSPQPKPAAKLMSLQESLNQLSAETAEVEDLYK